MLFDIEAQIEKNMRFFEICQLEEPDAIEKHTKDIRKKNKEIKQIENNVKQAEEEERKNRLRNEKQKIPRKVEGIRMKVFRSTKPNQKQKE